MALSEMTTFLLMLSKALESGPRTRFLVHVRCLASSERLNLLISLHHPLFAFYCLLKLGLSSEEKGRCSNA